MVSDDVIFNLITTEACLKDCARTIQPDFLPKPYLTSLLTSDVLIKLAKHVQDGIQSITRLNTENDLLTAKIKELEE